MARRQQKPVIQTRRESSAWKTKHRRILAAALDEFIARGFVGASMDQIAERADVSKVTIYNHFANKDELYHQMVRYYLDQLHPGLPSVNEAAAGASSVREALIEHGASVVESLTNKRTIGMIRLLRADPARFLDGTGAKGAAVAAPEAQLLPDPRPLSRYLSKVSAAGDYHVDDAEVAARQYYGMVLENTMYPALLGHAVNLDKARVRTLVESCVDALLCTCDHP